MIQMQILAPILAPNSSELPGIHTIGVGRLKRLRRSALFFPTSWLILDSWINPVGIINRKASLDLQEAAHLARCLQPLGQKHQHPGETDAFAELEGDKKTSQSPL